MLLAIKIFLRKLMLPSLYFGGIGVMLATIFRKAEWGLLLLVFIFPFPNVYLKLRVYPYGWMFIDFLLLSILLGTVLQGLTSEKSGNEKWIILVVVVTYASMWNASLRFGMPSPIFTSSALFVEWKNYVRAFLLYFVVKRIVQNERQQKIIVLLISLSILLVSLKSYRNFSGGSSFSWDKRVGGPFEAAGLGSNHFGAFIASYCAVILGLLLTDSNKYRRLLYAMTVLFSLHPLLYSYSRGAYLGFIFAVALFGILKKRMLLVLLVALGLTWRVMLPESVVSRITMTETENGELEGSAAGRLALWGQAIGYFKENPVFGMGYSGFTIRSMGNQHIMSGGVAMTDTHNIFIRTLCEGGIVGLAALLVVFIRAFASGHTLLRTGQTPFQTGMGLGLMGCVIAIVVTNAFGDRWSYLISSGYFWVVWALVDRSVLMNATALQHEAVLPAQGVKRTLVGHLLNG